MEMNLRIRIQDNLCRLLDEHIEMENKDKITEVMLQVKAVAEEGVKVS